MEFDWDPAKASRNIRKHGIRFEDATTIFADPYRIEGLDEREDYGEIRWLTVGHSGKALLSIVYTLRGEDETICRLISARKADDHEETAYRQIHARY